QIGLEDALDAGEHFIVVEADAHLVVHLAAQSVEADIQDIESTATDLIDVLLREVSAVRDELDGDSSPREVFEPPDLVEEVRIDEGLVLEHGDEGVDLRMFGDFSDHLVEKRILHSPAGEDIPEDRVRAHLTSGLAGVDRLQLNGWREWLSRHVVGSGVAA